MFVVQKYVASFPYWQPSLGLAILILVNPSRTFQAIRPLLLQAFICKHRLGHFLNGYTFYICISKWIGGSSQYQTENLED